MTIETFNFPYHATVTENPVTGTNGALGGSYSFTAPPTDPDQRTFTLSFESMFYFLASNGLVEANVNPLYNMKAMIDFYSRHKLYKTFKYNHPVYGELLVRFHKPLTEEAAQPGGSGIVRNFTIQLIEIP
jgi:hypothetical protein